MARLPLRSKSDLPDEYQYLLDEDALGERNLFRSMGHNPHILQSYMRYGTTLWQETGVDERTVELAILAVARTCRSTYEWHQHVELGRKAGVSAAEIRSLGDDDHGVLDDRDRAVVEYVQAVAHDEVDDATFEAVATRFDARTIIGLSLLAGHYLMTARMLSALEIPTEGSFVGWQPADLN
jgi:4-carboxymuconolactone decarboxylase